MKQQQPRLFIGPDETGAVVLWTYDDRGIGILPVSEQNGNWSVYVDIAKASGRNANMPLRTLLPIKVEPVE